MTTRYEVPAILSVIRGRSLIVGLVAGALCIIGAIIDPGQFFPAYLIGLLFWWGISLGCLATLMIHHLTGGGWGIPIRRVLESAASPLPLLGILFLPVFLGMPTLYSWARPEVVAVDELIQQKTLYLNVESFQIRAAAYFVIWTLLMVVLNRWSSGLDPAQESARRRRLSLLSGPGLILWGLTVTFASVDWVMSLEPHWFSSMYGVLFMGAHGVSGLGVAIITVILLREHRPWSHDLTVSRQQDMGSLLLAFVLFWSYVSFMQFLIIWSGNLPEETPYYLNRSAGGWQIVAMGLGILHFLLPLLLLLSRQTKRSPRWLVSVAVLLLVMRLVDLHWLVMPTFSPRQFTLSWQTLVSPVAIGGIWVAMFTWRLSARAGLPVYELREKEKATHDIAAHAH